MLEAGISSTRRIASFWGISKELRATGEPRKNSVASAPALQQMSAVPSSGVQKTIEEALRAAGLLL
jgi:hypothetical protein